MSWISYMGYMRRCCKRLGSEPSSRPSSQPLSRISPSDNGGNKGCDKVMVLADFWNGLIRFNDSTARPRSIAQRKWGGKPEVRGIDSRAHSSALLARTAIVAPTEQCPALRPAVAGCWRVNNFFQSLSCRLPLAGLIYPERPCHEQCRPEPDSPTESQHARV